MSGSFFARAGHINNQCCRPGLIEQPAAFRHQAIGSATKNLHTASGTGGGEQCGLRLALEITGQEEQYGARLGQIGLGQSAVHCLGCEFRVGSGSDGQSAGCSHVFLPL